MAEVLELAAYDTAYGLPDRNERTIPLAPFKRKLSIKQQILAAKASARII